MRKKTAPLPDKHNATSNATVGGLIAPGKRTHQSAKNSYALDNSSHRTIKHKERRAAAPDPARTQNMGRPAAP
jgi:hypothetical protein